MGNFINHFLDKLGMILSTIWGWVTGIGILVFNTVVSHKIAITLTVVVVLLDLVWGIARTIKQHQFTTSELMRDSVSKFAVYGTAILTFCILDRLMGESVTLTTVVICSVIVLVELWSILANALIVFPNMPFLKLLQPTLGGEIASKLSIKPEEVKEVFDDYRQQIAQKREEKKKRV